MLSHPVRWMYSLSSLSMLMISEICCTSNNAATLGSKLLPRDECAAITCVYPPFFIFSTSRGAQFSDNPRSYASFSTAITLSNPLILDASCAIVFAALPAMKPCTEPPSFSPAVTAPNEPVLSFPSRCSRMASVDSSRARNDDCNGERGRGAVRARIARSADCRAKGSMMLDRYS